MNPNLNHLPRDKQKQIAFVVETIRAGFAHATARRSMPRLRGAKLLKIILFGSYARGGWVDDAKGRYFSDFDILCVVDREEVADWDEFWWQTDRNLLEAESEGRELRTPYSLIVHSLDDVNEQLRLGRYFFIDIVRDGIVLHEEEGHPFDTPQPLTAEQALTETQAYFEEWSTGAREFRDTAVDNREKGRTLKRATFMLHQAAEQAYQCLLLVRTLYSPRTHRLSSLRGMTEDMEPRLREVWPNTGKFERRCFALLNDAYVKARYSPHYRITVEEFDWLVERITMLIEIVEQASHERLAVLAAAA
jgi:uncharacterized protein